ncbi:MAG: hypothetical protein AB7G93_12520 [Bdellovibrionales bacterium]
MFSKTLGLVCFALSFASFSHAALNAKKVLVVVTGASQLELRNGEVYETGYWLEEFSVPYQLFEENGLQMTVATPNGNRPTVDHGSAAIGNDGKPLYWSTIAELNEALAIKKESFR